MSLSNHFRTTTVSFSRSGLLWTPLSRRIHWNSVSPVAFLMVHKAVCASWRASRHFAWSAVMQFPKEWRSMVVRMRWSFWTCHNFNCCVADRFGKDSTRPSSGVLIKSSSKASTSGRAWCATQKERYVQDNLLAYQGNISTAWSRSTWIYFVGEKMAVQVLQAKLCDIL